MYCQKCGSKMEGNYCIKCGYNALTNTNTVDATERRYDNYNHIVDSGGFGLTVIGFLFPMVGLILYLVWRDNKPISAHDAIKGSIISFVGGILLYLFLFLLMFFFPYKPYYI